MLPRYADLVSPRFIGGEESGLSFSAISEMTGYDAKQFGRTEQIVRAKLDLNFHESSLDTVVQTVESCPVACCSQAAYLLHRAKVPVEPGKGFFHKLILWDEVVKVVDLLDLILG